MKKAVKIILIGLFLMILIYDTYQIHFKEKDTPSEHLNIEYENGGNILLQDIKENDGISMKIKVKNKTDHNVNFTISFLDVVNDLVDPSKVTYSITKEENRIEIHSDTFPQENTMLQEGDLIEQNAECDYILTIRIEDINELDQGKDIQARIQFLETDAS